MKLWIIFVCLVAVISAKKPKRGKTEKKVDKLCSAYDEDYATVSDPTYDEIFSQDMLGDFCDGFLEAFGEMSRPVFREKDGIALLSKACNSYEKGFPEEPTEGPLVGFDAICNASDVAAARTLNDKKSINALEDITEICEAQVVGNLNIQISNFTEVFEDMEVFCDVYMEDTDIVVMTKRHDNSLNGIDVLDGVCRWYTKKFELYEAENIIALLDPICEEFEEIKTKPKRGKTEKKVDKLCSAYDEDYATVSDPTYDEIFSQDMLGDFCDGFLEAFGEMSRPVFREKDGIALLSKACNSYEKGFPEEPTEGPLVGFDAICNASDVAAARTLNDKKSINALEDITEICEAQVVGNLNIQISNFTEVFEDMEVFCDVYMEDTDIVVMTKRHDNSLNGIDVLDGVCRWYTKKFELYEAENIIALLDPICEEFEEIKTALEDSEDSDDHDMYY